MSIAGIDFSTNWIDIVVLDEDDFTRVPVWIRCNVSEDTVTGETLGDAFERARRVRSALPRSGFWEDSGVIAIGIEQPRGNYGTTPLFRMQGAILACLPTRLLVTPWNPSSWRVGCGMKGNASKDDVREFAVQRLLPRSLNDWQDWPQDAFDAYCIARATSSAVEIMSIMVGES